MRRYPNPVLVAVLFAAHFAIAQASPFSAVTCTYADIPVTVVDDQGNLDLSLNQTNFRAESKRMAWKVTAVRPRIQPPRAMLIVDTSESMREPQKAQVADALALGIIAGAKPESPLALVTFSAAVEDHLEFGAPKELLTRTVQGLKDRDSKRTPKHGRTALYDSIYAAVQSFGAAQPGDTIFLVTDGGDNASLKHSPELRRLLVEKQIRVFAALMLTQHSLPIPEETEFKQVEELATYTGGGVAWLSDRYTLGRSSWDVSPKALAEAMDTGRSLYAMGAMRYEVQLQSNGPVRPPIKIKLLTVTSDGKAMPHRTALYPHVIAACTTAPVRPGSWDFRPHGAILSHIRSYAPLFPANPNSAAIARIASMQKAMC